MRSACHARDFCNIASPRIPLHPARLSRPTRLRAACRPRRVRRSWRMRLITIVSSLLLAGVAFAQAQPPFSSDRFKAHVAFLADDLLEGRDTGTRGHEIAARYVATQFASFGLKPGGTDGDWYQRVTLQKTTRKSGSASLTLTGPAGEKRHAHGDDILVG